MGYDPDRDWPFLARDAEMALLVSIIEAGMRDRARPAGAVIVAAPGVGKTRLAAEAARSAEARGVPVLRVIGTRAAAEVPYAAVMHLAPDPHPGEHPDPVSLYHAIAAGLPKPRPLLVVDDAQRLDPGSAALVLHLALTGAITPLVTARRGDPVPDAITALWKESLATRIDLPSVGTPDMEALIRAGLAGHVARESLHRLATIAAGNVMYARELVRAAVAGGALVCTEGMWIWDGTVVVGDRLVDAVGRRLGTLTAGDRHALVRLAVGEPLGVALAEEVIDADSLIHLEAAGLIGVVDGAYRLEHPLISDVVLARAGAAASRRALREIADAADRQAPSGGDLLRRVTWRLDSGGRSGPEDLMGAARRALAVFDAPRAERFLRALLAEPAVDDALTLQAHVVLADALNRQQRFAEASGHLLPFETQILATGGPTLRREWLDAAIIALHQGLGRADQARALLERVETSPDADDADRRLALAMHGNLLLGQGRLRDVIRVCERVVQDPQAEPDYAAVVAASALGEAQASLGLTEASRRTHGILLQLRDAGVPEAQRAGDYAVLQGLMCLVLEGRVDEAAGAAEQIYRTLVAGHEHTTVGLAALTVGRIQVWQGRVPAAQESLREAIDLLERTDRDGAQAWAMSVLAQADALAGDTDGAQALIEQAQRGHRDPVPARSRADLAMARVRTRAREGDATGAGRIALDAALGEGETGIAEYTVYRAQLLHMAARLGVEPVHALALLDEAAAQSESDLPGLLRDVVRAIAEEDVEALTAAAKELSTRGMRIEAMDAATEAATMLRRTGHHARAERTRRWAAQLAHECGLGKALPDTAPPGAELLSAREREVAVLAADGLTNAEIAARLHLSVRTVESHLYQAYGKLGIDRRDALPRALARY